MRRTRRERQRGRGERARRRVYGVFRGAEAFSEVFYSNNTMIRLWMVFVMSCTLT
jgi:hypothetical protein